MSRLIFRSNDLDEFYVSGMLYDNGEVLAMLGACRSISIVRAKTEEIRAERYFHKQMMKKQQLPPFFAGEITYQGEFPREIMALLELGRLIHVGKMATFGNGMYEVEV
jgi:CRISPR/Cas system endoribonuclease Cas6 (RAMP superfamily)